MARIGKWTGRELRELSRIGRSQSGNRVNSRNSRLSLHPRHPRLNSPFLRDLRDLRANFRGLIAPLRLGVFALKPSAMFELLKTDAHSKARLGRLTTAHGVV